MLAPAIAIAIACGFAGPASRPMLAADKPAADKAATSATDSTGTNAGWDRQAAARYLDDREIYWQGWEHAKKDHGTMCVSCHTQATYGLVRPVLGSALGEQGPPAAEQVMLASI